VAALLQAHACHCPPRQISPVGRENTMTWNYRVINHRGADPYTAIHEVYYDKDGKVVGWTENPVRFVGDDKDDLISTIEMALEDAKKRPALETDDA
jgi:hypothetical protein